MGISDAVDEFTGPAWVTAMGTAAGYAVILVVMTILLFGLPYLVFVAL